MCTTKKRRLRRKALGLLVAASILALSGATAQVRGGKTTVTDKNNVFSIKVPKGWRWKSEAEGSFSRVQLLSKKPFDISIMVTSRPLEPGERRLGPEELLGRMIDLTVQHQKSLGSQIINVGRVKPFVGSWPAFAVVTASKDGLEIITSWGTVTRDRDFGIVTLTKNLQGSSELEAVVREVVDSLTVH